MSLFDRIKRWLTPKAEPPTPKRQAAHHHAAKTAGPLEPTPQAVVQPVTRAVGQPVERPAVLATVTVVYRMAGQTKDLRQAQHLQGEPGQPLTITWAQIPGYVLTEILGFVDHFPAQHHTIYCRYEPRFAGPVLVYHRDASGTLLTPPELLTGQLNTAFTAHALPAVEPIVVGPSSQSGQFTAASQHITFTYAPDPVVSEAVAKPLFVRLTHAKDVYARPMATTAYPSQLPANTVWRVHTISRTQDNGVWFDLGGAQWITAQDTVGLDHNPFTLPTTTRQMQLNFMPAATEIRQTGVTLPGDAGITRWQEPYGTPLAKKLGGRTRVTVIKVVRLDNGSQWFQLKDQSYVLAQFVQLELPPAPTA